MDIYSVPFPHCDQTVLHTPGKCVHCDHYPTLQNVRINNAIPFSGEGGSPDEKRRSRDVIDRWGGNRPVKKQTCTCHGTPNMWPCGSACDYPYMDGEAA